MNVGELKAMLDDYGDHVEVVVEDDDGDLFDITNVDYTTRSGEGYAMVELGERIEG